MYFCVGNNLNSMKKTILSLIVILFCLQSFGQTVRIGNGTDTCNYLPFSPSNWTHYSQQIILASEINADSTSKYITDIGFDKFTQSSSMYDLRSMDILIGNTTANSLSQGYLPHSQMILCKNSSFTTQINASQIHLDTPFEWDRTSNIVISYLKNTSFTSSGNPWGFLTHTTIDSLTKYDITSGYSLEYPPTQGILTNERLNTQLTMIGCFKPDSIQYSNISSNSINFNVFKKGDATNWEVQYKEKTDTSWANAISIIFSDTNISLINLIENTYYNVRVRSVCSQWNSSQWIESEFKTKCLPISNFPYLEQFTGNECWENLYNTSFRTFYNANILYNTALLEAYSSNAYLISPALTAHLDSLMISFEVPYSYGLFTIGVMSSSDTNTFQPLLSIPNPHGWYEVNLSTSTLQGVNNYIALKLVEGATYITNLKIDFIPPCPSINNINVHTISPTQISVDWSKLNSINNGYQIAYNVGDSFDTNIANIVNLNDTIILPYVIDNLLPSTNYSIAVRQNCGSEWSVKNEKTYSLPAQLPYSCDFEDSIVSYSWTFSNNENGYFGISQDYDSINKHLLDIRKIDSTNNSSSTIVASRLLKFSGAGGYKLSFKTKSKNVPWYATSYVKVYVIDPDTMYYGLDNMNYYSVSYHNGSLKINNQYSVELNNSGDYIIDLPYLGVVGTVKKLMFVVYSNYTDGALMGLDDIKVEERECVAPELSIVNSSVNNVELSWTSGYSDSTWTLFYKPIDSIAYSFVSLDTTSYILDSLNQTQYNAYVRVLCGNGNWIESSVITFSPQCKKITLPFSENFDNRPISSFPFCWTKSNNVSLNNQTSYAPTTTLLLNSNTYVSLPQLEDSISISSTVISFKYRKNGYYSKLIIGVMENPNDLSTFDTITIFNTPADYLWHRVIANLNNYTGLGKYIAILSQNANLIDDITIDYINPCPVVYDLRADSISYNMVRLRWDTTNNQHQAYQISYLLEGDSLNNETIINVNDTTINFPYQCNGLNSNSNYRIGIRQNCGGNWSYTNITTKHAPATLPYYCDFSAENERNAWEISNGNAPNKWFIGQAVSQSPFAGYSLYVSEDNGLNNTYSVGYFSTGDKNSTVVASRLIELTGAGSYTLNFNSRVGGENNNDYIKVFLVDEDVVFTGSATSTSYAHQTYTNGVILFTGSNPYYCNPANPTAINNHSIQLPYLGESGTIKKLIFVWTNNARNGTQPPAAIDNISFVANNCTVSGLNISNITNTNALASWTSYVNNSSWYLYYKELDSINYDSIHIVNDTSYNFTNLLPNTKYNFYIRKDCGDTLSDLSPIITIKTLCDPISNLPFYDDFESYSLSVYPECWLGISNSNNWSGVNSSFNNKELSLSYPPYSSGTSSYAILSSIDTSISVNSLLLKFSMLSNIEELTIGIMSDNNDESTFDSITTFSTPSDQQYHSKFVYFNNYTGIGRYIAFKAKSNNTSQFTHYAFIDNVFVDYYNNCFAPESLRVDSVSTNSAMLSWSCISLPNPMFRVFYKKVDDVEFDSMDVMSSSFNLFGLEHSSLYNLYVSSICSNGELKNSDTIMFKTLCSQINTFPYVEDFENYINYGYTFPYCWIYNYGYDNQLISYYMNIFQESTNSFLKVFSPYSYSNFTLPQIDEDINLLKVSFSAKTNHNNATVLVGVMSDFNDSTSFELVSTFPLTLSETQYEVYFNQTTLSGNNKYIAFKVNSYLDVFIDDVIIDYIPSCSRPSNINFANITSSSVDIDVIPFNNNPTSWWIFYKRDRDTIYDSVYVSNMPYTLNGLEPLRRYNIYAKNVCGQDVSTKSELYEFWTFCYEITSIPHQDNFNINYAWDDYVNVLNRYAPCWTTCENKKPALSSSFGSYALEFGVHPYDDFNDYKIAITPKFDNSISISNLKLTLDYRHPYNYGNDIVIGVISNPDSISTFDSIASLTPLNHATWYTGVVDFSTYTGNGQYIAFMLKNRVTNNGNSMLIDNLLFEYNNSYSPPCAQPNLLSISNISDSSAYFTWSPVGDETSWEVSLDTLSLDTLVNHIIVNDTNYQFSHLTDSTLYTAYVRSNCAYSNSQWVGVNFTTLVSILEGEVETLDATSITDSSVILNGLLVSNGNATTGIEMGFLIDNQPEINLLSEGVIKIPIIYNNTLTDFHYRLLNLPSDSLFYYTTYFSNIAGDVYGTVKNFTTLSLNQEIVNDDLSINIFPNPTNNSSIIRINNLKEKAIISVYDLYGRQLKNYDVEANKTELTLDTKNYPSGIYYIKLTTNNTNKTIKLIVNH